MALRAVLQCAISNAGRCAIYRQIDSQQVRNGNKVLPVLIADVVLVFALEQKAVFTWLPLQL
jgi:hypothetical protein